MIMLEFLEGRRHCARGYATLFTVLVAGAVASAVSVALLLFAVDASRSSQAFRQSSEAKAAANACAETALNKIVENNNFTGTVNLNIGAGSCQADIANTGGNNRTVLGVGVIGNHTRRVFLNIDRLKPSLRVSSWQEIP